MLTAIYFSETVQKDKAAAVTYLRLRHKRGYFILCQTSRSVVYTVSDVQPRDSSLVFINSFFPGYHRDRLSSGSWPQGLNESGDSAGGISSDPLSR